MYRPSTWHTQKPLYSHVDITTLLKLDAYECVTTVLSLLLSSTVTYTGKKVKSYPAKTKHVTMYITHEC
jgi:hypothetical protein